MIVVDGCIDDGSKELFKLHFVLSSIDASRSTHNIIIQLVRGWGLLDGQVTVNSFSSLCGYRAIQIVSRRRHQHLEHLLSKKSSIYPAWMIHASNFGPN